MDIKIIDKKINRKDLLSHLNKPFPDMVKFVVDVNKKIIAVGGEMHADAEEILLQNGSTQSDLWGGNVYPQKADEKIEYTSLINIRPADNNRSMEVQDASIKEKMKEIVYSLLPL